MAPLIMAWRTVAADAPRLSVGSIRRVWLRHLVGAALVLTLVHRSPTPMWVFVMGFVYFGSSLTALRSFAEHRASIVDPHPDTSRAAVVQSGWLFSLLFLNNNLHHTHHQLPGAAWFRLPELSRVIESATVAGAGVHPGYGSIARRYLFRPLDRPVHPMSDSMRA